MKTIKIGADELILWLRKNKIATTVPNDQLGAQIRKLIESLGGALKDEDIPVYWDERIGSKNIDPYQLPKTAAQYEISTDILEDIYDTMLTW